MVKKKKKASSLILFPIILIIIVSSYAIRHFYFSYDTEIIKYGTMQDLYETTGLIVRNELAYNYSSDLQFKNKVSEGQRVPYGKKIVEIVIGDDIDANLLPKINKLDERINEISKTEKENNIFEKDIEKIDKSINEKTELIKLYSQEGNFENITEIKNSLSADLYKKSLIAGDNSFSGKNLEQLLNEKMQLENLYVNNLNAVYAKSSGIVSYNLDGLEQSLSPVNIEKFGIEEIKQIITSYNDNAVNEDNQNGVKLVEDYAWYICCILKEELVKELKEGNRLNIIFKNNDEKTVSGKIVRISDIVDGESIVTFEINEYVNNYYNNRVADITIITQYHEGYLVSQSGIVENEKQKGIFINKKGIIRFVPVEILAYDDGKVLVQNIADEEENQANRYVIKLYDEVLRNTKNIKANQKMM
jgi:putative membrane fusion protein